MALGANVRTLRERRRWTLDQLSEASGVDVGTISALENRDSKRSQFVHRLAAALGVSVEHLQEGDTRFSHPSEAEAVEAKLEIAVPEDHSVSVPAFTMPPGNRNGPGRPGPTVETAQVIDGVELTDEPWSEQIVAPLSAAVFPILVGAVREHLAALTSRGPWATFVLGLVPFQLDFTVQTEGKPDASAVDAAPLAPTTK